MPFKQYFKFFEICDSILFPNKKVQTGGENFNHGAIMMNIVSELKENNKLSNDLAKKLVNNINKHSL